MVPTSFEESNLVLGRPEIMSAEECDPLSVLRIVYAGGETAVISCWKLTKEELEEVNKTGRVWLMVRGYTMPPVSLHGHKPFKVLQ